MCGICGIYSLNKEARPDIALLRSMTQALAHRGPDAAGLAELDGCSLGHRRLSVLDIAGGSQPLSTPDKRYTITYNGEIYNHLAIREELSQQGKTFCTQCDTETLLAAFAEWGPSCLDRLNGMFAFAIYDAHRHELFLARDRLGVKPLFHAACGSNFIFASELHALRLHPQFNTALDPASINHYLSLLYVPSPRTVFRDAHCLPPAHWLRINASGIKTGRYWTPNYSHKIAIHPADARVEVRKRIIEATRLRLLSDVPLGAFLSGGIDSTIVAGAMAEAGGRPPRTFAIGSPDPRYDELAYAQMAAKHCRAEHMEAIAQPVLVDNLRMLLRHCGQPFADSSILPSYQVSAFARQHVTVALSGDGADELCGGYERYAALALGTSLQLIPAFMRQALAKLASLCLTGASNERSRPARIRRFLKAMAKNGLGQYMSIVSRWRQKNAEKLLRPALMEADLYSPVEKALSDALSTCTSHDPVERWMELEAHTYLPEDVLTKVDRASMAVGLEVRSPFLDYTLWEYFASLPLELKMSRSHLKRLLRESCADLLPPQIKNRGKMGFGVPVGEWLKGSLRGMAEEALFGRSSRTGEFFELAPLRQLFDAHVAGRLDASYQLWALLCLELWRQEAKV